MVKSVKDAGGYARRIEDQYAVGIVDTILIPRNLPVFMAEVKIVKSRSFAPTPRQYVELCKIAEAGGNMGYVIPVVIGWGDGNFYFHEPAEVIQCHDCFSVTTSELSFNDQLVKYYFSGR